jgi:3-hydroxyisobutyrate dehydrogenase-like beta-hydroxyacid dehydrogenase
MTPGVVPVGVIGTGELGICLVDRFRSGGHEVWVFDTDGAALARAAAAGARPATGPAEVAERCPVVLTCVTGPDDVRACALGPGGLSSVSGPEHLVIDTTTSLPATTRMVADGLGERGTVVVDAPVSRGVPAARRGELSVMVGGALRDVDRARSFLALLGTDIVHVGPVGAGHAVKLVNMALMGVHLVALAEAIGSGARFGLDPTDVVQQLAGAPSASYMTEVHLPRYVLGGTYDSGFRMQLMAKDLRLAGRMAEDLGVEQPLLRAVNDVYDRACGALPAMADNMLVVPFVSGLAAGMDEDDAATAARDGQLPTPEGAGPADRTGTMGQLVSQVTATNRAAADQVTDVLTLAGVERQAAFSVIDVSSGSSYWTGRLAGSARGQDHLLHPNRS